MKKFILFIFITFFFLACKNDNTDCCVMPNELPNVDGLAISQSENSFDNTYNAIRSALQNNDAIGIVAEVDHEANAESVDLELGHSKVILFGNPNLGTPLMQENQLAGLDLPQKILVYEKNGNVFAAYNSTGYLSNRYNLTAMTLEQIEIALSDLVTNATNVVPTIPGDDTVDFQEGVVTVDSNKPFSATYDALRSAIADNSNLKIIAELDHQENGTSVGKTIRPTRLIVFGNPRSGTPLMQNKRSIAIDLPQKMLVWQDDAGITHISYNDPDYLASRHAIDGNTEILKTISDALSNLSEAGAK
ncbi:DUF302 domain-containing protein [Flavimarina sp. Hel_I_48]|uniref:DUF302 domain-containing protein n=1 Tax=Flavimarina sp. Hel_I_48 TaxID=1392488 RepID=UPI0004DECCEA|nr:DUF302 domain-containing protein [Flavimarina sp. Hel_I_48]